MSQKQTIAGSSSKAAGGTKSIENSAAARGYVATQNSLNGLLNDLLGTVKGIRKQQKEQQETIEELTKQVQEQRLELERLRRGTTTNSNKTAPISDASSSSLPPSPPAGSSSSNSGLSSSDLAQFRRELVGIIGEALAQHEEEHHDDDEGEDVGEGTTIKANNPYKPNQHGVPLKVWEEFCSTVFPRHLTRTFHSNGATVLEGRSSSSNAHQCSYIDYPMAMMSMMPSYQNKGSTTDNKPLQKSIFSWSFQTQGQDWAVGIATFSNVSKWGVAMNDDNNSMKILGDTKGEWAYRSDGTLWSHNKQRQQQQQQQQTGDKSSDTTATILTLILEFHFHDRILLKGSINSQQQQQSTNTTSQHAPVVWFDIPWKNFKKPTAFVPAVTCHNNSTVRFRGWKM